MSWDSGILNTSYLSLLFGTQGRLNTVGEREWLVPRSGPRILLWEVEVSITSTSFNPLGEQGGTRKFWIEVEHRLGREAQFWGAWFQEAFPELQALGRLLQAAGRPLTVSAGFNKMEILTLFSLYLRELLEVPQKLKVLFPQRSIRT